MRLLLCLILLFPVSVHAQQGIEPDDIRLELTLEDRPHPLHIGEMILLLIRGTFKVPVVRESLQQSPMSGFDWMQLGEDHWYKAREDGFEVLKFERRMALFPQTAGTREIPPFVHKLEVLNSRGATVHTTEDSNSLSLTASEPPETEDWWFPVRDLEISDRWSNQPEALATGAAALRIVALTVTGTAPQRIPPMPEMTGAGAFVFPHPEQKIVTLGPDGPITRVFWRWTVRPDQDTAGYMNPIPVTYFDTEAREMRTLSLSAQRVAYAGGPQVLTTKGTGTGGTVAQVTSPDPSGLPSWATRVALFAGLFGGLVGVLWPWHHTGFRIPPWLRHDPIRAGLRRAVRARDPAGVWRFGRKMVPVSEQPKTFRVLDSALFGSGPMPDLNDVSREIATRRLL